MDVIDNQTLHEMVDVMFAAEEWSEGAAGAGAAKLVVGSEEVDVVGEAVAEDVVANMASGQGDVVVVVLEVVVVAVQEVVVAVLEVVVAVPGVEAVLEVVGAEHVVQQFAHAEPGETVVAEQAHAVVVLAFAELELEDETGTGTGTGTEVEVELVCEVDVVAANEELAAAAIVVGLLGVVAVKVEHAVVAELGVAVAYKVGVVAQELLAELQPASEVACTA